MSFKPFIFCTILLSLHGAVSAKSVTKITDDDFVKMIGTNDYIIILFTTEKCKPCETMEYELMAVQEELIKTLDATIGKIYDSRLAHVYSPDGEPALVFFRHGVPLLYVGEVNHELILHNFVENKEPTVKELNDENFEHLTQATTGSTTGDWFIMFYSKTCSTSRKLTASWEAVGAALRTKMNVARISIETPGFYTSKRFGVFDTPTFKLLHHGQMYTFVSQRYDFDVLIGFARNFKQLTSTNIPVPASPVDFLLNSVIEFFEGNDWYLETGLCGIILGLIGAIFIKYMDRRAKREEAEEEEEETDPEHEKEN